MDELTVWSWSHATTDAASLERVLVQYRELERLLREGAARRFFREAVVLSTCNRLELYAVAPAGDPSVLAWLTRSPSSAAVPPGRVLHGTEAVRHLFRVATGLESVRRGEIEIHAQARSAAAAARRAGTLGPQLRALFDRAVAVSRAVRDATGLDAHVPRLGAIVADVIRAGGVKPPASVVVVGSGQLARSVLMDLQAVGYTTVVSTRRPREAARQLSSAHHILPMLHLEQTLERVDAAVFATSVSHTILDGGRAQRLLGRRSGQPILLIDLGVPSNLAVDVHSVDGAIVRTLASLTDTTAGPTGAAQRRAARLVADEADAFEGQQVLARRAHLIVDLRTHVHRLVADQLASSRALPMAGPDADEVARALANRILHRPTQLLKAAIVRNDDLSIDLIRQCFGLAATEHVVPVLDQGPYCRAVG